MNIKNMNTLLLSSCHHLGSYGQNFDHFRQCIGQGAYDDKSVQQIDWNPMRRRDIRAPNLADSSVGGENDIGGQRRFKSAIEVCETLNVKHVHLLARISSLSLKKK